MHRKVNCGKAGKRLVNIGKSVADYSFPTFSSFFRIFVAQKLRATTSNKNTDTIMAESKDPIRLRKRTITGGKQSLYLIMIYDSFLNWLGVVPV